MFVCTSITAKKRKRKMKFAETWIGVPKMPDPFDRNIVVAKSSRLIPECVNTGL